MTLAYSPQFEPQIQTIVFDNFSDASPSIYKAEPGVLDILSAVKRDVDKYNLLRIEAAISELKSWERNWDGYDSEAPNEHAIDSALTWFRLVTLHLPKGAFLANSPHITASSDGEVMLEWWHNGRKLTIYIGENVEYIKVWGIDIDSEMEHERLTDPANFAELWTWLHARDA